MTSKIEEEGRRMLISVVVSTKKEIIERIVKAGNPSSKIVELVKKLDVELIMRGSTGIDNSDQELVYVARRVLRMPIVFSNEIFK